MNRWIRLGLTGLGLCLSGCAMGSAYEGAPAGGSQTAELRFHKGYHGGQWGGGSNIYSVFRVDCSAADEAGRLLWSTPDTRTGHAPAPGVINVLAITSYLHDTGTHYVPGGIGFDMANSQCILTASFRVEPGHTYDVTQHSTFMQSCTVIVTDSASGQPAQGLQIRRGSACRPGGE